MAEKVGDQPVEYNFLSKNGTVTLSRLAEDSNSMDYNSGTKPTIAHEKFIVTGQPATSTSPVSRLTQSQEKVWLKKKEKKRVQNLHLNLCS